MTGSSASRQHPRWRSTLFEILWYGLAAGCLVWVFTGIHWRKLGREVGHADLLWLIVATLLGTFAYVIQAWRWNLLLRPVSAPGLGRTLQAVYVGALANDALPFRPGELISCYLVARWNEITLAVVLSSLALMRLLDGFSLVVSFFLVSAFLVLPGYFILGVRILTTALVIVAGLLMFLLWKRPARAIRLLHSVGSLRRASEGIRQMANVRTQALSTIASLVHLASEGLPYWALGKSLHLALSIWPMMAVFVIAKTATSIPSAPGNAGLLQAACVLGLGLFGIDKTRATGFSLVLFFVLALPQVIAGASVMGYRGLRFRDLRRGTFEATEGDLPAR